MALLRQNGCTQALSQLRLYVELTQAAGVRVNRRQVLGFRFKHCCILPQSFTRYTILSKSDQAVNTPRKKTREQAEKNARWHEKILYVHTAVCFQVYIHCCSIVYVYCKTSNYPRAR